MRCRTYTQLRSMLAKVRWLQSEQEIFRADLQFRVKERWRQMGLQQEAAAIEHRGDAQVEEADEAAPIQADVARAAQS